MMWSRWSLLAGLTLLAAVAPLAAWDADLELLDLVEEIPETFYRFMSVEQDATSTEIKKAYRRLSLVLHPDKNKDEDAENQFRQLVAIYEVLKDEERRRTYDDILVNGLPDWRQPVFYYRRVRKLSNAELLFLLCLILTVGHYAVIWSIYLEKQLDEMLSSKKKKEKKKKPNPRPADEPSPRAQERPQWQDILPLKISIWLYLSIKNLPQTIQELKLFYEEYQQLKQQQREEEEEAEQEVTPREKRPKVKKPKVEFPVYEASERLHGDEQTRLHGYDQALEEIEDQMDDWLQEGGRKKVTGWTEEEVSFLSRLMVKFPGGTPGRWDKIAVELGRSVAEVTTKVKQVKDNVSNTSGLVKLSELKSPPLPVRSVPDELMTQRGGVASEQEEEAAATVRKRNKKPAAASNPGDGDLKVRGRRQRDFDPTASETEEEGPIKGEGLNRGEGPIKVAGNGCGLTKGEGLSKGCGLTKGEGLSKEEESSEPRGACPDRADPSLWSQNQQKLLELALTQFPRGTAERWDRVAKVVPGKTKEECMHRFKMLAELIQKKKASKS